MSKLKILQLLNVSNIGEKKEQRCDKLCAMIFESKKRFFPIMTD